MFTFSRSVHKKNDYFEFEKNLFKDLKNRFFCAQFWRSESKCWNALIEVKFAITSLVQISIFPDSQFQVFALTPLSHLLARLLHPTFRQIEEEISRFSLPETKLFQASSVSRWNWSKFSMIYWQEEKVFSVQDTKWMSNGECGSKFIQFKLKKHTEQVAFIKFIFSSRVSHKLSGLNDLFLLHSQQQLLWWMGGGMMELGRTKVHFHMG